MIKNNKLYGKSGVYTTKGFYERALNGGISSILLNLKVTPEEIEKHHFQIERSPESLINQKFLKEKYPPEFELQYKYRKRNSFQKSASPTTKSFYLLKLSGIIKEMKDLNGILGNYIPIHLKTRLNLIKSLIKKLKLLKKFKWKMRAINLLLK
ncbi:hypothetical protein SD436_09550 [Streptococcus sp. 2A/TPW/M5]